MTRLLILALAAVASTAVAANTPVTLNACAATSCLIGTVCEENNGVARCVSPQPTPGSDKCKIRFEQWVECAGCEATCDNKQPICTRNCRPARCMCQQGFFRSREGKCVTENDCDVAALNRAPETPRFRRSITCANVRCAGVPCVDTPTGPACGGNPSTP